MKVYTIGTCGHYDTYNTIVNGQTVRTQSITNQLQKEIGKEKIKVVSYHLWRKRPISTILKFIWLQVRSENLLLFPDARAVNFLIPLAVSFKRIFLTKVYYNVIGGWLPNELSKKPMLLKAVKKLDGIFVQTTVLKNSLEALGVKNVTVFPNFKDIKIYSLEELSTNDSKPLKLCFLSRITEQKGVIEMIDTIKHINCDKIKFTLDIYGPISDEFVYSFEKLRGDFPSYINYKGVVESFKTSEVIKNYFLQLFPTKYRTEGFPGSILDSFCAGVPVLASKWNSYADVIDEGVDGLTFDFENFDDMKSKLNYIYDNPLKIVEMKSNCLDKAKKFKPEEVIKIMIKVIFGDLYEKQ